jgi:hypothetical protein
VASIFGDGEIVLVVLVAGLDGECSEAVELHPGVEQVVNIVCLDVEVSCGLQLALF